MTELIKLKSLLIKLTKEENRALLKKLRNERDFNNQSSNSIKLLEILNRIEDVKIENICYELYEKVNIVALKKLTQRLTENVLEYLIDKDVIDNNSLYDRKSKEIFKLKHKLLYYDILNAHGVNDFALTLLNQIIKLAIRLEYYDYLIIALEKKQNKMSIREGMDKYNEIYNLILHYSNCNKVLRRSQYLLRLYSTSRNHEQKIFKANDLKKSIIEIERDNKRLKSKSVTINIFYLNAIYFNIIGDNNNVKRIFSKLMIYLKRNKDMVFEISIINCLLNMAESETNLWEFKKSLNILANSHNKYLKGGYNIKLIEELVFINYYYLGDLNTCYSNIDKLVSVISDDKISAFILAKRFYYLAIINSLFCNYSESNKNLLKLKPIEQDREGWNIGVRILSIMNNINLEKYNLVESQIENLRKYCSRIKGESNLFNRFVLISKILVQLVNKSFNFNFVVNTCYTEFEKLKSINTKYSWKLKSPEMIPFHEWFDSKVKNVPYDHAEVMKRLKKLNKPHR